MNKTHLPKIAELNERFQKEEFSLGRLSLLSNVEALAPKRKEALLQACKTLSTDR